METFDYIVVGAGSSGATLARRLAERPGTNVLLLEAGPARERDFWVRVPLGVARLLSNPTYMWQFQTEPQALLAGQRIYWPRGKLPGGSSSVNGMIYVRGDPAEFDHWASLGNAGWSYRELLPYFRRLESFADGREDERGRTGPVGVTNLARDPNPLADAFIGACAAVGIAPNPDYNGSNYEGVGYLQLSTRDGQRSSTALAYLHGLPKTPRLSLRTGAQATQIVFEGDRAVGVRYLQDGQAHEARAAQEVILSSGPIKSPQLLEVSGIGHPDRLNKLGIPVRVALPGVGENLIDHLQSRLTYAATQRGTLNEVVASRLRTWAMGARYMMTRRGIMATPSATAHALARATQDDLRAAVKIQIHHLSGADRYANTKGMGLDPFPGFSIGFFQLRPHSRGTVHARTPNGLDDPQIEPNYFDDPRDVEVTLAALRMARRVAAASPLADWVKEETRPGPDVQADDALVDYLKTSGQTSWHPVGTCKMGVDAQAVVDPALRVHGVGGLRVVDSSIMPTMPSSNTNAASIMIGEKAADLLRVEEPAMA